MAKNTFLSFDTTASNNTDIAGIDIQGTAAVMNFDNAFRQLMAILRTDLDNGQVFVTKAAGYTALAADNNAFYEFTASATLALTAAATLAADWHMMVFANGGAVTINPDGAELINGAATLVVADGNAAYIICTGTAFKAITIPSAASVALKADLLQPYADVASATTTDIGAAASQNVNITGTTTITGFGTVAAGTVRDGIFADILTLTHNGTSLILPGAANITTAAGDSFRAVSLGSGNWRVTEYELAAQAPSLIPIVTDWTAETPVFQGFGTVASVEVFSRRNGDSKEISGRFNSGVPTASDAQMTIGTGLTIDSTKVPNIRIAGSMVRNIATTNAYWPLMLGGVGYISFGLQSGAASPLTPQAGNALFANGNVISFNVKVPITGW